MPKFPMFNNFQTFSQGISLFVNYGPKTFIEKGHQKSEIQYMRKILIDRGVHVNKVDLLSVPSLIIKHFAVKLYIVVDEILVKMLLIHVHSFKCTIES